MQHANVQLDFGAIVDDQRPAGEPGAREIIAFTRALVNQTSDLPETRDALVAALGEEATSAVAGSIGNFEMMNRILDATGVPKPGTMDDIRMALGA